MGSKKHKKHHKSEKKEQRSEERNEKPLRLVLKVSGGAASRGGTPSSDYNSESNSVTVKTEPSVVYAESNEASCASIQNPEFETPRVSEKHKKSKKKKKKKSSEKDKEKKHKHHHHHHHHHHRKSEKKVKAEETEKIEQVKEEVTQEATTVAEPEPVEILNDQPQEEADAVLPPALEQICPSPEPLIAKNDRASLQVMLISLFKSLQKKDPDQFFAWPVSDVIAPGYSSIIQNPMDFSTMKEKIDKQLYSSIDEFKADVKLLCDNCMVYNRQDTVYYKSAKKLVHSAMKLMNKDKLVALKRTLLLSDELPNDETSMDTTETIVRESPVVPEDVIEPPVLEEPVENEEGSPPKKKPKPTLPPAVAVGAQDISSCYVSLQKPLKPPEAVISCKTRVVEKSYDDMTPDEILKQAQEAAKCAADKLTFRRPNSDIGFLRQRKDGSTSLAIVNPDGKKPSERDVNFGMLIGKLKTGTGTLNSFKEDQRNIAKPLKTLNYGSFCSFAPQYDSAFSNLNKEETELINSCYGDDVGVQYAESLINFAHDSDYVMTMVDSLLDTLTNGEHSKTTVMLEEKKRLKLDREQQKRQGADLKASSPATTDNLDQSGIKSENYTVEFQKKLDKTAELIQDLQQVQHERLSQKLPSHLSQISSASEKEIRIAEQVQDHLKELTQQATPQSVIKVEAIRKAMGIVPATASSSS